MEIIALFSIGETTYKINKYMIRNEISDLFIIYQLMKMHPHSCINSTHMYAEVKYKFYLHEGRRFTHKWYISYVHITSSLI